MNPSTASTAEHRAPLFAALGDGTRLHLLERLGRADAMSISELTERSGVTRQAVTKHLRVLQRAGLVSDARKGREHLYRVNPEALCEMSEWLEEYRREWEARLDRLDDYLQTLQQKDS